MQAQDGTMVGLNEDQFRAFVKHGNTNLVSMGDPFMIRDCYFEVVNISEYGIMGRAISKKDYFDLCKHR